MLGERCWNRVKSRKAKASRPSPGKNQKPRAVEEQIYAAQVSNGQAQVQGQDGRGVRAFGLLPSMEAVERQ